MLTFESVSELSYQDYRAHQQQAVSPAALREQAERLRASDKFKYRDGNWQRMPYRGYALLSMLDNNLDNDATEEALIRIQRRLVAQVPNPEAYFLLPPDSFHQTVANTVSADRFQKHVGEPGLEPEYPTMIKRALEQIETEKTEKPLVMRLLGLSIFRSALGILGVFDQSQDFERIIQFRDQFYANPELNQVDVRRTRPFIGHVTLAYVDGEFTPDDWGQLAKVCANLNKELTAHPLFFNIAHTELRSYHHLAEFTSQVNYPVYSFVKSPAS
ncbi:MAG: DUF1868 domain-containing protein [Bacteroidota bacterium]